MVPIPPLTPNSIFLSRVREESLAELAVSCVQFTLRPPAEELRASEPDAGFEIHHPCSYDPVGVVICDFADRYGEAVVLGVEKDAGSALGEECSERLRRSAV
jgi:hypothetical protein